jgi:hypothetical protein
LGFRCGQQNPQPAITASVFDRNEARNPQLHIVPSVVRVKNESKMYNITVISTDHTESGKCNSDELYKIIKSINPEVIFEEMPNSLFNIVYNSNLLTLPSYAPLELKCVKKYLQNHNTKHFPVDIDSSPKLSKDEIFMFNTFAKNEDYTKLESEYNSIKKQEGLDFLNSNKYLDFFERKSSLEKKIGIRNTQ